VYGSVILDLDQTLVDSQRLEPLRRRRRWREVYSRIPTLSPFKGVPELLSDLHDDEILTAVVTSSPSSYCHRVLDHFGWQFDVTVCYHDTQEHKPDPEPIRLALDRLDVVSGDAISVGDAARDTLAARAAGVSTVGAFWGTMERTELRLSNPCFSCETVRDLRRVLGLAC
jgi:HAD superfamily hydrolase (TIGR01509 family)